MSAAPRRREELLSLSFNQDSGCFACGTDLGFRIYNCDPFKETFRRRFDSGGIGQVEMLFRCNILALVGGGRSPRYSPNKVMIWDDHQSRCIGELSFRVEVRAVRLRRDRVVVVLEHKIYVYNFADLKILHQTDTVSNPLGLCALSPTQDNTVMACPGLNKGQVRVELYDLNVTKFISAHDGELAQLQLTLDGALLATASEKGTLIRVYDTARATLMHEFRRGADRATIYSIAFAPDKNFLAVSSDKGTVHVYVVPDKASVGGGGDGGRRRRRQWWWGWRERGCRLAGADSRGRSRGWSRGRSRVVGWWIWIWGGRHRRQGGVFVRQRFPPEVLQQRVVPGAVQAPGLHQVHRGVRPRAQHSDRGIRGRVRLLFSFVWAIRLTPCFVCSYRTYYKVGFDDVNGGACTQLGFARFMKTAEEEEEGGWGSVQDVR